MSLIPYLAIAEALQEGAAVPFLGAHVNFGHRMPGNAWENDAPILSSCRAIWQERAPSRFKMIITEPTWPKNCTKSSRPRWSILLNFAVFV